MARAGSIRFTGANIGTLAALVLICGLAFGPGISNYVYGAVAPMFESPKWTAGQSDRIDYNRRQLEAGLPVGTFAEYLDGRLRSVSYASPVGSRVAFMDNFGGVRRRGPTDEVWLEKIARFVRPTDPTYPAVAVKFFAQKDDAYLSD